MLCTFVLPSKFCTCLIGMCNFLTCFWFIWLKFEKWKRVNIKLWHNFFVMIFWTSSVDRPLLKQTGQIKKVIWWPSWKVVWLPGSALWQSIDQYTLLFQIVYRKFSLYHESRNEIRKWPFFYFLLSQIIHETSHI